METSLKITLTVEDNPNNNVTKEQFQDALRQAIETGLKRSVSKIVNK